MEICTEKRDWSELIPDVFGRIFKDLSLKEKLTIIPSVCKSWGRVVCSPIFWQEIDFGLCSTSSTPEKLDRLLKMLILRSCGSLSKFEVYWHCTDALFSFLADNAGSLQTLIIPGNGISDNIVQKVANRMTKLRILDLTYSVKIGPKAMEAFGKNCKNLTMLRFSNFTVPFDRILNQNDIAFAIASSMHNLRQLEVLSLRLTNAGVHEILSKCKKLESLIMVACWTVTITQQSLKEKYPKVKVLY